MLLHGEPVAIGDLVFDVSVGRGPGKVHALSARGIECLFEATGVRATYSGEGFQLGQPRATLFWKNPIVVIPAKNDTRWTAQREAVIYVTGVIKNVR